MLIPSSSSALSPVRSSLSRRVNANSQLHWPMVTLSLKLIKKGECLIPSQRCQAETHATSLSRRVNANSQQTEQKVTPEYQAYQEG